MVTKIDDIRSQIWMLKAYGNIQTLRCSHTFPDGNEAEQAEAERKTFEVLRSAVGHKLGIDIAKPDIKAGFEFRRLGATVYILQHGELIAWLESGIGHDDFGGGLIRRFISYDKSREVI